MCHVTHPAHPPRELALQLAAGGRLENDTDDAVVERAEKYAAFLSSSDAGD